MIFDSRELESLAKQNLAPEQKSNLEKLLKNNIEKLEDNFVKIHYKNLKTFFKRAKIKRRERKDILNTLYYTINVANLNEKKKESANIKNEIQSEALDTGMCGMLSALLGVLFEFNKNPILPILSIVLLGGSVCFAYCVFDSKYKRDKLNKSIIQFEQENNIRVKRK